MAKAELNQIGSPRSPTLFMNFCKNTSIFLQLYFSISAISFAFLQHIPSTLRLNRTPLVQKTLCDKNGAPTDLLWWKKLDVTNTGPQPTSVCAKQDQTGLDRSARSTLDYGAKGLKVSRSHGLKVSRSKGLKFPRSQGPMVQRSQGLKVSRSQDLKV